MGFSLSWLAVRSELPSTILKQLRLALTCRTEDYPESKYSLARFHEDWIVIVANDYLFVERAPISSLSIGTELVACAVEDHVMSTSSHGWQDGKHVWSIEHHASVGRYHLDVVGTPPPHFNDIRMRLFTEQDRAGGKWAVVDCVYDIPAEVAASVTGYRHDMDLPDGLLFEILEPVEG